MRGGVNVDTDNDRPTLARVYRSLRDICPDSWNLPGGRMPTGLGYDFLRPVEDSGINDLKHYYFMADLADGQPLGRANLYSVCFDLATTDRKLTPAWRTTIKRWFPGFMTFRFLECGLLTMVSNPLALRSDTDLERVLPVLAGQMDQLAHDDGSDFLMIRDVDPEHYQRYLDILRPLGFRPALGFSRVDTTISWSSVEEALGCLSHKRRLPLKTSLEFRERFGIEVEELDEYAEHAPVLARLWRNVKTEAKDYQREDLNPEFFAACSRHLHGRSRLWLFRYQGTPIAFFLNVWGADENYILLEWGIDRDFEHYRKANLYRAALMLSLKDAISRDKRRMEMGITNYFTKLRIPGARVIPTIYFLRHSTDPVHTATLARMMMHNIQRPTLPDDMSEEFCRWEERIRLDQDGLPEHDIFRKIDRQHKYTGLKLGGVYGFYPRFTGPQRSTVKAAELGEIVLLGTNSYLGLATHPEVVEASAEATRRYGTGCSGSPLLNGTLDLHVSLEQELACFFGQTRRRVVLHRISEQPGGDQRAMRIRGHDHPRRAEPPQPVRRRQVVRGRLHLVPAQRHGPPGAGATPHRGAPPDHRRGRGVQHGRHRRRPGHHRRACRPARLPGLCGRVPCAGRARPRRARSFGRVGCLGAHGRGDGHVQQILCLRRRVHRRRSARRGLHPAQRFRSCVFRQPAAGRRGCHPRGSARQSA